MFIPLHDANSLKHIRLQYVTLALIAANVVIHLTTALAGAGFEMAAVIGLGYIPSTVFDIAERPDEWVQARLLSASPWRASRRMASE